MISNYILIAWRSLKKNKLFSFINIFGLALSMSVCMMVMIRMIDVFSVDNFHANEDRIFRIISEIKNEEGNEWLLASTPLPLRDVLEADTDLFDATVSLYPALSGNATDGEKEVFINGAFTQPSFFQVFSFSLASGDGKTSLLRPNSIVLSHETAAKLFGSENPLGRIVSFEKYGTFEVTGVLNKLPSKSHIDFDAYISFSSIEQLEKDHKLAEKQGQWDSFELSYTYVLLPENLAEAHLEAKLRQITSEINNDANSGYFTLLSQNFDSISPSTDIQREIGRVESWGKIITEISVALIILLAACFNYTNLSIARALTRTKEVGIRKVVGANRLQVFIQYIVESVLMALFALCFAHILLAFILEFKPFNDGYKFTPAIELDLFTLFCFFIFALFSGILAGTLPAWILSSFNAVKMLRNVAVEKIMGSLTLRKILIVFQFSLSLVVIIFLSVFYRQFSFMASADMGFAKDNIVTIPFNGKNENVIKTELSRINGVESAGAMSSTFVGRPSGYMPVIKEKSNTFPINMQYYFADENVIQIMGLNLRAGRNFTDRTTAYETELILNQKAIEVLGFKSAAEAIGEKIWIEDTCHVAITGVIENFYNQGVGNSFFPMALRKKAASCNNLIIKVSKTSDPNITREMESVWKKIFPDKAFSYHWLDKTLEQSYDQTASMSLMGFLAFVTVAIASLGLLGLVVYTVETKRKEISIRKIIGASVNQLMLLLSKGFASLLLIAGCIAIPIGFILSQLFLLNFANRITLGLGTLIGSFLFLLAIGLTMIMSQTYKASVENPAKNLRSE